MRRSHVNFVLGTLLVSLPLLAVTAPARPAAHHLVPDARVGGYLRAFLDAQAAGDTREVARQLANGRARWDGNLLELQLHLPDPDALTVADLGRFGGRLGAQGTDLADIWLDPVQLPAFLAAHPEVTFVQLPIRGVPLLGPHQSQGATHIQTPQEQCLANDGTQTTVAVLDEDFASIDASVTAGELHGYVAGNKLGKAGDHGTMCAETVADVAPAATLVPWSVLSLAGMQTFQKEFTQKGNPKNIRVVSHSVGWFGQSFGRSTGPLCAVTDAVRGQDVLWVNAAGNNSGGGFWQGQWRDKDGNHTLEFQDGSEKLRFYAFANGPIQMIVDWDDYEGRTIDLDATLWRKDDDAETWTVATKSALKQGKNTTPAEWLVVPDATSGEYAISVTAKGAVKDGLRIRAVSTGYTAGHFSIWTDNGSVYDPASCEGVLTVGALRWSRYQKGPLEDYSSYGPTVDGRQKPEVVAATGTTTSQGDFYGTSCACPHTAGVAALYRSAHPSWTAEQTRAAIIRDAVPMGDGGVPDTAYGWGRVEVPATSLEWTCDASLPVPAEATCATACGSVGHPSCGATCQWATCAAPSESCNGHDDNCDGVTDEGCPDIVADAGAIADDAVTSDVSVATTPTAASDSGCTASSGGGPWRLLAVGVGSVGALLVRRRQRTKMAP